MKIEVKNGLIYCGDADIEIVTVSKADKIARANFHPGTNTPFTYAEHFVRAHDGKQLVLNSETLKIEKEL